MEAASTSGSSAKGSTTASSSTSSSRSLDGVPLSSRASRAVDLAVLRLPTGMHEKVSRFCMVLRNGSNKAYAALAMVNDNISKFLLAQAIAEPALLEKVVIEVNEQIVTVELLFSLIFKITQHVLSVLALLSKAHRACSIGSNSLGHSIKMVWALMSMPARVASGRSARKTEMVSKLLTVAATGVKNGKGGGGKQQQFLSQKQ
ncbi:hypothetical protein SARC_11089 [Sphaeroforma arctica JP610]|uniref:Uncharacterized protein n=1 Tax=Sphaeroforma arctica JP610 TaxID=667725 RepID=A0A0L0FHZ1_9EUKA|nr:hypothetical protein SARC_11089 [Sphaeroforma arctica JP610]KNC76409.1 hypothetical protein SARC_11089 [Sphaeroforma arctica JP610]|eukprot:XP_014150311.1 hypothetical protein SARC_11089 [Sphaeroforma arctica JP610]